MPRLRGLLLHLPVQLLGQGLEPAAPQSPVARLLHAEVVPVAALALLTASSLMTISQLQSCRLWPA